MKKVFIMTNSLGYGGVAVTLVNMLKNIDYSQYSVDLVLMDKTNIYGNEIPKEVKIKVNQCVLLKEQLKSSLKRLDFVKVLKILKAYTFKDYRAKIEMLIQSMNPEEKEYDYAIADHSTFQIHYIDKMVKAKKKIMYIHSNPYNSLAEVKAYLDMYERFDLICCVSQKTKETLERLDEKLADNTVVMRNIVDIEKIEKLSQEGETFCDDYVGTRILTVGRISAEKGYELAIEALKKLIDNQYHVKWYVIGEGQLRKKIEEKIKQYHLEEYCILLGAKKNPYHYIKDCDIYVQPSLSECYCTTTIEAKLFNLPIVRTNTPDAEEQFVNMENGIITNMTAEGLYDGIVKYMDDESLKYKVIENLKKEDKKTNCIDQIAKIEEILEKKG